MMWLQPSRTASSSPRSPRYVARANALSMKPAEVLRIELQRRLLEVEAETTQLEAQRRLIEAQAEARLVAETKREVEAEFSRCRDIIDRAYTTALGDSTKESWWAHEQARREAEVVEWEQRESARRAHQLKRWEEEDRLRLEADEREQRARLKQIWDQEEAEFRKAARLRFEAEELRHRMLLEAQQASIAQQALAREREEQMKRQAERDAWQVQEEVRRRSEAARWDAAQREAREAIAAQRRQSLEQSRLSAEREAWEAAERGRRVAARDKWEAEQLHLRTAASTPRSAGSPPTGLDRNHSWSHAGLSQLNLPTFAASALPTDRSVSIAVDDGYISGLTSEQAMPQQVYNEPFSARSVAGTASFEEDHQLGHLHESEREVRAETARREAEAVEAQLEAVRKAAAAQVAEIRAELQRQREEAEAARQQLEATKREAQALRERALVEAEALHADSGREWPKVEPESAREEALARREEERAKARQLETDAIQSVSREVIHAPATPRQQEKPSEVSQPDSTPKEREPPDQSAAQPAVEGGLWGMISNLFSKRDMPPSELTHVSSAPAADANPPTLSAPSAAAPSASSAALTAPFAVTTAAPASSATTACATAASSATTACATAASSATTACATAACASTTSSSGAVTSTSAAIADAPPSSSTSQYDTCRDPATAESAVSSTQAAAAPVATTPHESGLKEQSTDAWPQRANNPPVSLATDPDSNDGSSAGHKKETVTGRWQKCQAALETAPSDISTTNPFADKASKLRNVTSLLVQEAERAAAAEKELKREREAAIESARRASISAESAGNWKPNVLKTAEQQEMEMERSQFSSSSTAPSSKLAALRAGTSSQKPVCSICGKTLYPTEQINIDGYLLHIKPCGRCRGREGCSNRADRMAVTTSGDLLPLCKAHFTQKLKELGVPSFSASMPTVPLPTGGSPPSPIKRDHAPSATPPTAAKAAAARVPRIMGATGPWQPSASAQPNSHPQPAKSREVSSNLSATAPEPKMSKPLPSAAAHEKQQGWRPFVSSEPTSLPPKSPTTVHESSAPSPAPEIASAESVIPLSSSARTNDPAASSQVSELPTASSKHHPSHTSPSLTSPDSSKARTHADGSNPSTHADAQVHCPRCTFLNPINSAQCSMCKNPLPNATKRATESADAIKASQSSGSTSNAAASAASVSRPSCTNSAQSSKKDSAQPSADEHSTSLEAPKAKKNNGETRANTREHKTSGVASSSAAGPQKSGTPAAKQAVIPPPPPAFARSAARLQASTPEAFDDAAKCQSCEAESSTAATDIPDEQNSMPAATSTAEPSQENQSDLPHSHSVLTPEVKGATKRRGWGVLSSSKQKQERAEKKDQASEAVAMAIAKAMAAKANAQPEVLSNTRVNFGECTCEQITVQSEHEVSDVQTESSTQAITASINDVSEEVSLNEPEASNNEVMEQQEKVKTKRSTSFGFVQRSKHKPTSSGETQEQGSPVGVKAKRSTSFTRRFFSSKGNTEAAT